MFERLSRSSTLVKASAAGLQQDRKLLFFPLISTVAMFAVLLSFALPVLGLMFMGNGTRTSSETGSTTLYVVAFLFYLSQYFVIFFFNAALVAAAMARLNGDAPSVRDSLKVAASKWTAILGYAAIAAKVGMVLRAIQERVGFLVRIVAGLLGAGLMVMAISAGSAFLLVLCTVLIGRAILLSLLVHGALSGMYAAALYRYATQGGNTQGFDSDAMRLAFVAKA